MLPALRGSKIDPGLSLKDGARSSSSRARFRSAFVVGQVALSVLLVVLGALFVRVLRYAGAKIPALIRRVSTLRLSIYPWPSVVARERRTCGGTSSTAFVVYQT